MLEEEEAKMHSSKKESTGRRDAPERPELATQQWRGIGKMIVEESFDMYAIKKVRLTCMPLKKFV